MSHHLIDKLCMSGMSISLSEQVDTELFYNQFTFVTNLP